MDKPAPVLTLQERMQKSLARQMDAVAAMQRSVEARQQTMLRQKSLASGNDFFTLPAPAPMSSPFQQPALQQPPRQVFDNNNNDETNDGNEDPEEPQPEPDRPEPDRTAELKSRPPVSVPLSIALPADIAGIKGIDGIGTAGDLSLEGILLRQFTAPEQDKPTQPLLFPALIPVSDGKDKGQSGNNSSPRGPGSIDYIRQILDFSIGGASLFQGLTGVR